MPATVLIVDNEKEVVELVRLGLNIEGYSSFEAYSGKEALKMLEEHYTEIELVLLDIMMDDMDGIETLNIIRSNSLYNNLPVIMLTARPEDDNLQEAFAHGADDYISKPFTFDTLLARVNKALHRRRLFLEHATELTKLNKIKNNFELILENASFGLLFISNSGNILFMNKYIKDNFIPENTNNNEELGSAELYRLTGLPVPKLINDKDTLKINYSHSMKNSENETRSFFIEEYRVFGQRSEPLGIVQIIVDITEHKKMEDLLVHSDKLASIGKLAASLAHEINNPLTLLSGILQILKTKKNLPDEFKDDVDTMFDISNRLKTLIEKMLVLSRKNDLQENIEKINLVTLIDESIKLVEYKLKNSNISIERKYSESDEFFVYVSKWSIVHCFVNILMNAVDASENHGDKIIISLEKCNDNILVKFRDFGCGISEKAMKNIFKPFYTTKPAGKGTGLGLYIVKYILDVYHAKIEILNAQDGKGIIATVSIKSGR